MPGTGKTATVHTAGGGGDVCAAGVGADAAAAAAAAASADDDDDDDDDNDDDVIALQYATSRNPLCCKEKTSLSLLRSTGSGSPPLTTSTLVFKNAP